MKLSIAPLTILGVTYASVGAGLTIQRRAVDFFDPAQGGGSIFDNATFGGEPLNVSTSAYSHLTRSPSLPVMGTGDLISLPGHYIGTQLSRSPHRRWSNELRQGDRLVSAAYSTCAIV